VDSAVGLCSACDSPVGSRPGMASRQHAPRQTLLRSSWCWTSPMRRGRFDGDRPAKEGRFFCLENHAGIVLDYRFQKSCCACPKVRRTLCCSFTKKTPQDYSRSPSPGTIIVLSFHSDVIIPPPARLGSPVPHVLRLVTIADATRPYY